MRVFIYDELEIENKKTKQSAQESTKAKIAKHDDEVELQPGEFNRVLDGVYEKGIFTWTEGITKIGPFNLGGTTHNMDILFNKTVRLPLGNKKEIANCAKAVFDGMNYVQIGWGLISTISKEERELSRANLIRDYENMKLSDDNKMTKPLSFLQDILPWFIILAFLLSAAVNIYGGAALRDSQKPLVANISMIAQDNHALIRYLMTNTLIIRNQSIGPP